MIELGTEQADRDANNDSSTDRLHILCDDRELRPHSNAPWLRHWLSERLGLETHPQTKRSAAGFRVSEETLSRHALVCGATGSGKTRLCLHLVAEQLKAGASLVMLDPKADTLRHVLSLAKDAHVPPSHVSLLWPRSPQRGVPGWNPLEIEGGASAATVAQDFVSLLSQSTTSWGPRLQDILTNALIVIATHGLSLIELARFLRDRDYREALLKVKIRAENTLAYREAHGFFTDEFARWGTQEQTASVAPVLNKLREFLRNPFLRTLLCARHTTLPFSPLWQEQRVILVHLDRTALGDDGVRLLSGLLAWQVYRAAMRQEQSRRPVVLALDEMGVSEQFLGTAVGEILAVARSQRLRLLLAFQHFAQLSDGLRTALLANAGLQVFFRLGNADARPIAASLPERDGAGNETTTVEVSASSTSRKDPDARAMAEVFHPVQDAHGNRLRLTSAAWRALTQTPLLSHALLMRGGDVPGSVGSAALGDVAKLAHMSGVSRLYVEEPGSREPVELCRYLRGVPREWIRLTGPAPVQLVIRFPRPKYQVVAREESQQGGWVRTLQEMPPRHAAVSVAGAEATVIRVVNVPDPSDKSGVQMYMEEVFARSGQSGGEVADTERWREATQRSLVERAMRAMQAEADNVASVLPQKPAVAERPLSPVSPRKTTPPKEQPEPRTARSEGATPSKSRAKEAAKREPMQIIRIVNLPAPGEVAEDGSLA